MVEVLIFNPDGSFDEVLTPNLNFGLTGETLCLSFQKTKTGLRSSS